MCWEPVVGALLAKRHWTSVASKAQLKVAFGWFSVADKAFEDIFRLGYDAKVRIVKATSIGGSLHLLAAIDQDVPVDVARKVADIIAVAANVSRFTCATCGKLGVIQADYATLPSCVECLPLQPAQGDQRYEAW